jgi:hypothetical protein
MPHPIQKDPYANRDKQLFWLQDPRDNTCLGPSGFGVCDESSVWMLADRREGAVLVAPFETTNNDMCLVRRWCHSSESPAGLGQCKRCGAKHWAVTKDRRGYVKLSEDKGKNCLVRSKPSAGGKQGKLKRYKNTYEMQHCDKAGYTGLVLNKAEINSGFFLQAADGFCFDGERFVACDPNSWHLRWGVGVRFAGNGQAERYFYKLFETDVCLQRTGKGPRLGDCSHRGAKRWSLKDGRLAYDGSQCIVRHHDNSAGFVKCSEGFFEHVSPIPYDSSLAPTAGVAVGGGIPITGGGGIPIGGGGRLPLGY